MICDPKSSDIFIPQLGQDQVVTDSDDQNEVLLVLYLMTFFGILVTKNVMKVCGLSIWIKEPRHCAVCTVFH